MPIRNPYRLYRLYQGAGLEGSQAADIGETGGLLSSITSRAAEERTRGQLLAKAVNENKLDVKQLSSTDSALAGKFMGQRDVGGGGILGGIGNFFGNLGSDVVNAAKGLPLGLFETGKAMATDVAHTLQGFRHGDITPSTEATQKTVIDPTVDYYKYMYGGVGAPKGSNFFERFSEHPLQPLLDVATVASLGTGAAARAGIMPELISTTGRAPLVLGEGAEIPRAFSARPLRNIGQRITDRAETAIPKFGELRANQGMKRMQREQASREMAGEAAAVREHVTPLVETRKDLTPNEATALDYALRGWNTPEKIEASREMYRASLRGENPPGSNIADFEKVFDTPEDARKFVDYKANLPAEVEDLILNPTPRMVEAANATREAVQSGFERMGVTAEDAMERTRRSQSILQEFMQRRRGGEGDVGPEGGPSGEPPEGPPPPPDQPNIPPPESGSPDQPTTYRSLSELEDIGLPLEGTADILDEEFGTAGTYDVGLGQLSVHEDLAASDISQKPEGNINFVLADPDTGETIGYGNIQYFNGRALFHINADDSEVRSFMESAMRNYNEGTGGVAPGAAGAPEAPSAPPLSDEQVTNIARALQAMRGDWENYKAGLMQAGEPTKDFRLVLTSILMNKWADRAMVEGRLPDIEPPVWESLDDIDTWEDLVDFTDAMDEGITEVDQQNLSDQAYLQGQQEQVPEVPDTPQALFEQWGMGDQVDIPEIPDTPGAFFAKYGEPKFQPLTPEEDAAFTSQEGYEEPPSGGGPPEVTQPDFFKTPENYPIEPTWTPDQLARGFKEQRFGLLAKLGGAPESRFVRGRRDRRITPGGVTASNLFETSGDRALHEIGPEALQAGATRFDPKSFVEHVARRERDITAQAFDQRVLQQVAAKDPESGEPQRFRSPAEVEQALGPDWVLVHDQFPVRWFVGESEFLRDTINKLQEMQDMGIATTDQNVMAELNKLADDHAQEFVRKAFGAKKIDGVAVPRNFFEYQKRIVQATDPFDNGIGRAYARYIHRWRALTLAYMPRWAVNTAVGSFMLNMVKGVGPTRYWIARNLKREGEFADPRLAGVELGNITGMEYLEPGMHGVGGAIERQTGAKVTGFGEHIVERVQKIEDYFRRASFIQSLDRVAKQRMREMGNTLENFEKRRGSLRDEEYLNQLLNDPDLVQAAIDDLNKFSYNFAALGPYERRYVRMAIPFWGWYKFISKFAYRLPVEYPGRTNILAQIGMLGNMTEEEYGQFPEWLRGFIPAGMSDKGEMTYFSTLGVNPLGQFFNPLGPQGLVQGAVSVGQASPPIQALLSSMGVDTLRGGVVPISPQEGIGPDFFGSWIDVKNRREASPLVEGAFRRGVMGLLRAAPQFRMAEERLAGGRPVYPESVPFLSERPMPIREGTRRDTSILAALGQTFGIYPKHFDLQAYQRLLPERVKYARARNKTQLKRLRKSLRNP